MSAEAHPNIHAVGMTVDIIESLQKRVRGNAANAPFPEVYELLRHRIQKFTVEISTILDVRYGINERNGGNGGQRKV